MLYDLFIYFLFRNIAHTRPFYKAHRQTHGMETIWIIRMLFSAQGMQKRFHPLEHLLLFVLLNSRAYLVCVCVCFFWFFLPWPDASVWDQSLIWGPHTYSSQAFYIWPSPPSKGWLRRPGLRYQPTKKLPLIFFRVREGNWIPTQRTSSSPPLKLRELWCWETFQERNMIRWFEMELLGNQSGSASSWVTSPASIPPPELETKSAELLSQAVSSQWVNVLQVLPVHTQKKKVAPGYTKHSTCSILHASFDKLCFLSVATCVLWAECMSECMCVLPSMSVSVLYPNTKNFASHSKVKEETRIYNTQMYLF